MPSSGEKARQWLAESVLIVVSVLLGFAVSQYGESRSERERAARALTAIQQELDANAAMLQPLVPMHHQWVNALEKVDTSAASRDALDLFWITRPQLPAGAPTYFPTLRRSAWDTAVASGLLRLFDQKIAEVLSEIYRGQETVTDNLTRLTTGPFSSVSTFDPAMRAASARFIWLTMADILGGEEALAKLYAQHLPAIRAAAANR